MPCNSPNKVFYCGINPQTGKKKIFYTSRYTDYIWKRSPDEPWQTARLKESQTETHGIRNESLYKEALSKLKPPPGGFLVTDSDLVPCGQCIGCRIDYARQWATRIMLETKEYGKDECWFITFTYDDEYLPPARLYKAKVRIKDKDKDIWMCQRYAVNSQTGEIKKQVFPSISKREHELLMKRIRNHYGECRFFMSGEYGSKSWRCHYHYVLFGINFSDLKLYKRNFRGDLLYTSDSFVKNVWSKDKQGNWSDGSDGREVTPVGFVTIGRVDFDSANYVARYTLKKRKNIDKDAYLELGIEPEFCLMSRRPGIGRQYFEDNYEYIYDTDEIILPGYDGAFTVKPPSYFDSLLERYDVDTHGRIKDERRKLSDDSERTSAVLYPDVDLDDLFEARERLYKNKVIFTKKGEL